MLARNGPVTAWRVEKTLENWKKFTRTAGGLDLERFHISLISRYMRELQAAVRGEAYLFALHSTPLHSTQLNFALLCATWRAFVEITH